MNSSITIRLPGLGVRTENEKTSGAPASNPVVEAGVPDEALMAQICEGSREALAVLFQRYARIVRGVACRVLKDTSEADDLLQEIFLLVHRLCRTFDSSKGSAQLPSCESTPAKRRFLPLVGTATMIGRSSSWNSASITFAPGARCLMVG
jgi:sigma-70-like protein